MEWYQFVTCASALIVKPYKSLTEIFYRFRKNLFHYGFAASVFGNVAFIVSNLLMMRGGLFDKPGIIVGHILFVLIVDYSIIAVSLGLYKLISDFAGAQSDVKELCGAYLTAEFPYVALLPVALILSIFPQAGKHLFALFQFGAILLAIFLKIKAISLTTKLSESKSFGILVIPVALLILISSVTMIYLTVLFVSALS